MMDILDENALILLALALWADDDNEPIPQHNSAFTGHLRFIEVMQSPSIARFHDETRMDKIVFLRLLQLLTNGDELKGSRFISAGQKLMIFLNILMGHSVRTVANHWQHSTSTISRITHQVAAALMRKSADFFRQPTVDDPISAHIQNNRRYYPYFVNCVGALDGSHIPAFVSSDDQRRFRNRKGILSQNVLGVVSWDMVFTFVHVGWEGSAHDGRVLADAMANGLAMPITKYYLGDAGYSLSTRVLTPYRGVRYHLKEWKAANLRPANARELFNLRHSSLRNIIERAWGVVKKRWPILDNMPGFSFPFQCTIIFCCIIIHNFIRRYQGHEDDYDNQDDIEVEEDELIPNDLDDLGAINLRDQIAEAMWANYIAAQQNEPIEYI